jgi:hypothetical protein
MRLQRHVSWVTIIMLASPFAFAHHSLIELAMTNSDGSIDVWSVELNRPNNWKRQGWKSGNLLAGDKATLIFCPLTLRP